MSTIHAIYQSKDDIANKKEFEYTITNSVQNNNQTKVTTASQNMKSLTDALILLQESINTYLTSKLCITNEDKKNIEDT
ncbi:15139_t:CDS:1, partial [Rhizophagus irregularis]